MKYPDFKGSRSIGNEGDSDAPPFTAKELFTESLIFPITTFLAKTACAVALPEGAEPLKAYIFLSGFTDWLEAFYRCAVRNEADTFPAEPNPGMPYSCFERHLFYDLPKGLWKKGMEIMKNGYLV